MKSLLLAFHIMVAVSATAQAADMEPYVIGKWWGLRGTIDIAKDMTATIISDGKSLGKAVKIEKRYFADGPMQTAFTVSYDGHVDKGEKLGMAYDHRQGVLFYMGESYRHFTESRGPLDLASEIQRALVSGYTNPIYDRNQDSFGDFDLTIADLTGETAINGKHVSLLQPDLGERLRGCECDMKISDVTRDKFRLQLIRRGKIIYDSLVVVSPAL
jgi:hypothetical protein